MEYPVVLILLFVRYMDFFPTPKDGTVLFEKSAGYFDSSATRLRLSSLIPDVLIVIVLIDPADRAYSWYQVSFFLSHYVIYKYKERREMMLKLQYCMLIYDRM